MKKEGLLTKPNIIPDISFVKVATYAKWALPYIQYSLINYSHSVLLFPFLIKRLHKVTTPHMRLRSLLCHCNILNRTNQPHHHTQFKIPFRIRQFYRFLTNRICIFNICHGFFLLLYFTMQLFLLQFNKVEIEKNSTNTVQWGIQTLLFWYWITAVNIF